MASGMLQDRPSQINNARACVPEAAEDQFRALLEIARLPQHEAMEVSEGGEVDTKSGECTTSAGIADDRLCARHFYGSVSSATVILALRHSHRRAARRSSWSSPAPSTSDATHCHSLPPRTTTLAGGVLPFVREDL